MLSRTAAVLHVSSSVPCGSRNFWQRLPCQQLDEAHQIRPLLLSDLCKLRAREGRGSNFICLADGVCRRSSLFRIASLRKSHMSICCFSCLPSWSLQNFISRLFKVLHAWHFNACTAFTDHIHAAAILGKQISYQMHVTLMEMKICMGWNVQQPQRDSSWQLNFITHFWWILPPSRKLNATKIPCTM